MSDEKKENGFPQLIRRLRIIQAAAKSQGYHDAIEDAIEIADEWYAEQALLAAAEVLDRDGLFKPLAERLRQTARCWGALQPAEKTS